jgi:hypothetical protein
LKRVPVNLRKIGAKKSGKPIPSWRSGNVPPSQAVWEKFEYQSLYGRAESGIEHPLFEERSIIGSRKKLEQKATSPPHLCPQV